MLIVFNGCTISDSDDDFLIYYDGNYYTSTISDDYTYNSFWYPLREATVIDKAYVCNQYDINQIIGTIFQIERDSGGIITYQMNEVTDIAEVCVKFEDVNSLYYIGILATSNNGDLVFYNAHSKQSLYYLNESRKKLKTENFCNES